MKYINFKRYKFSTILKNINLRRYNFLKVNKYLNYINRYLNLELSGSNFLNECKKTKLNFYEVSKEVNKPTNNSISLIQKI